MEQQETALLSQWRQGDQESFDEIVRKYLPKVVNLAYRYLKDRSLAEDVAQEIFIKLYQNPDSWKPTASFSSWLYRVTFNACTDQWRKRKQNPESELLENQEISIANGPDTLLIDKETAQRIQQAIDALPQDQKKIILLYQEETSYEEIAEILGISVKGVERRLYRARNKLRHLLKGTLA